MWVLVLQRMFLEFLIDFIYFPLWWYTDGTKRAVKFLFDLIIVVNIQLSPFLWLKNIFVPMFGQWDWQGRLVSFFMRLANVIFRFIALLIWVFIVFVLFLIWLALPLFIVFMLLNSIFSF